jgi:hypothetical protein
VKSVHHPDFAPLSRVSDGSLEDVARGPFTIRLTAVDGRQLTDTFDWPAAGPGEPLTGHGNFQ